jgi:uncharacterized protein YjaG (DUF416 family)
MKYVAFSTVFKSQIFALDHFRLLSLAKEVCKKLYSDYVDFSDKYHWGDKEFLLDAILSIENLDSSQLTQKTIADTLSQLDTITPDIDDFESDVLASAALNACVAVSYTFQFIADKKPNHIYHVGICLTDTIDCKIQEQKELDEEAIDNNPLMIEARKYLIDKSK